MNKAQAIDAINDILSNHKTPIMFVTNGGVGVIHWNLAPRAIRRLKATETGLSFDCTIQRNLKHIFVAYTDIVEIEAE